LSPGHRSNGRPLAVVRGAIRLRNCVDKIRDQSIERHGAKAMAKQVRRVVTGHDESGKAIVISDGPAPFVHVNAIDPEWYSTDIWRTNETPARIVRAAAEPTLGPRRQMPEKRGTVLRINHFPPEQDAVRRMDPEASRRAFAALGNERAATFGKGGRHPLMHRTETIDYAIVLSGEITMVLDDVDVLLEAGDIVVQCGTNHAWSNRSNAPCVVAFVLIDGAFEPELAQTFA
jgi:mannose-6-phosphate isomerase-like protein (cupin superfamily)